MSHDGSGPSRPIDAMAKLREAVAGLDRLLHPGDLSFRRDGKAIAATLRPSTREAGESFRGRIWLFHLDGRPPIKLTDGPNWDQLPRWSPKDDRLAFASDRRVRDKMDLFILDGSDVLPFGQIPGTIEDVRWTGDGSALIVKAADRGLDGGATNAATRLWWGDADDPAITNPTPRRRLFRVDAETGATVEIGPTDFSVWEFDLLGDNAAIAIASEDASERGWYHAKLIQFHFAARRPSVLHTSRWQLQSPAASPTHSRIAFLEGWSSDRGLVASEIRILGVGDNGVTTLHAEGADNVTSVEWIDEHSLRFAGWSKLGSVYGVISDDGRISWSTYEDGVIGSDGFVAGVSAAPDKIGLAAVREAVAMPSEIYFKTSPDAGWRQVSAVNRDLLGHADVGYPEVKPIRWTGSGGLALAGLLVLPRERPQAPLPTIVSIHGGPSWAAKYQFDPLHAIGAAIAGYAVFLPNYRGNCGWGQDFAKLNIGDPAGAEFADILSGIDQCVAEGIADPDRLGVTGGSYGGYLTAWAVATTSRFKAAVMVSGIANHWSSHYSCNHDFSEFICGGPLTEDGYRRVAFDRSPLFRLDKPTTPTLMIHGSEDRCTPLGQAQEFYAGLREKGVTAEIAVYPREGHGLRERAHRMDAWERTLAWFDRYLRPAG